ncbi:hypothetical protein LUZ60_011126 [Juncus effusus]|nr:hypothetical protein LUZ60_011126 [Juncus effusus]
MKRFRSGGEEQDLQNINLAQVLMSISQNRHNNSNNMFKIFEQPKPLYLSNSSNDINTFKIFQHPTQFHLSNRQFECKTCNRQFQSFQALGGHRASHKKSRIITEHCIDQISIVGPTKPKIHECPICGLEFSIGQALGGHMRRHRAIGEEFEKIIEQKKVKEEGEEELCLDLNLAPPGTEWRKIGVKDGSLHKVSNMVDCFL